uniref:E3 ubiquitin-protein ligase CHFR n=1 Tax=Paramormyrops kingsleyae TaxID=1676925 RepID=A0A3B3SCZ5_9TELE
AARPLEMEDRAKAQPWGRLVKLDPGAGSEVLLVNKECTVGRRRGCDLSFPANKLVSGDHCKIVQDEHSGEVWLEDMSTNGTVINMSKLVKKQVHPLQSGDVIYFVYRKNDPEQSEHRHSTITAQPVLPLPSEKDYEFDLPDTESTEAEGPHKGPVEAPVRKGAAEGSKVDKMEESLTCIICQDLLYDCVSLQPCMHTFCAACYSSWMERSSLCPTCRCPVERIRKNHILNNLVEAYLLQHPEKSRSEEDLKNMDMRNKITEDMVQPKLERSLSDEEGSSDYLFELSDNDSDTSDISQPFVMCRQCPGYRKDGVHGASVSGVTRGEQFAKPLGEGPSTSASTPSALQEYTCPLQGSHVICTCCLQPMPDRRGELANHPLFTQQCATCHLPFCHMYWGCQRTGCQGCLAPFSELNLTEKCLDGVLNSNNYESDILQNYLASRGMSWKEMLQDSLQALQQGTFHLSDYRITANTVLCHCCGLRAFKELAYKYRQNIPASELPAAVTSRPDCYWGRNCRTQVKAHHAM